MVCKISRERGGVDRHLDGDLNHFYAFPQVPETPHWLISHHRPDDAEKSLQWLRGWVSPAAVSQEFSELKDYIRTSTSCAACVRNNRECSHRPSFADQARELMRSNVVKPFVLVVMCFIIVQSNGIAAIKPFLVQVFEIFGVPMDPNWASVSLGQEHLS